MAIFENCIGYLLTNEGGYQSNPNDSGNWVNGVNLGTNYGISAPKAVEFGWNPTESLRLLTEDFAKYVYKTDFWPGLEGINSDAIAAKILDMRVSGKRRADRYIQQGLVGMGWNIAIDGVIGPQTRDALNRENESRVMEMLKKQHAQIYSDSAAKYPSQIEFLGGWLKRAAKSPMIVAAVVGSLGVGTIALLAALAWISYRT